MVCAAGKAVFSQINRPAFLAEVAAKGEALMQSLRELPSQNIVAVRGAGLMIGVEFSHPVRPIIRAALERGLVVINAGENVLRLCPALVISQDEIAAGVGILAQSIADCEGGMEP